MSEAGADGDRTGRFLPVLAAVVAAAVAWWASRPYAVGVFHDDGVYAILAKSIATGQGYRFLHLPGAPVATHYPPAYPLFLAALWRMAPSFPANVSLFLFVNALLLGATTFGVEQFAECVLRWPRPAAVVVALVATLSTPLLMLSGLVLSEPLFVAALFPAIIAAERLASDGDAWRRTVLVGVGAGVLALVRTHGLALVVALVLVLAMRRRWRAAILCTAVAAATLAPWELWLASHSQSIPGTLRGSYGPYTAWLADGLRGHALGFVPHTMLINAREVGALLADHFSLSDGPIARQAAMLLAVGAIAAGAWQLSKRAPVFVAFAVVYTLVLLAWPYTPWRFVFAMWPVVVLCVAAAIEMAWAAATNVSRGRLVGGLAAVGVVALVAGAVHQEARSYERRSWTEPAALATAAIAPLVRWVSADTRVSDVVAVDGEQVVYLFTNRHAVPIAPFTAAEYVRPRSAADNAESLRRLLDEFPVRYVLTISPALRESSDLVVASSEHVSSASRNPSLVRIAPLGAGEAYRVERQ